MRSGRLSVPLARATPYTFDGNGAQPVAVWSKKKRRWMSATPSPLAPAYSPVPPVITNGPTTSPVPRHVSGFTWTVDVPWPW